MSVDCFVNCLQKTPPIRNFRCFTFSAITNVESAADAKAIHRILLEPHAHIVENGLTDFAAPHRLGRVSPHGITRDDHFEVDAPSIDFLPAIELP